MENENKFNFIPSPYFQTNVFKFDQEQRMIRRIAGQVFPKEAVGVDHASGKDRTVITIVRRRPKWHHCRPAFRNAFILALGILYGHQITSLIYSIWSK